MMKRMFYKLTCIALCWLVLYLNAVLADVNVLPLAYQVGQMIMVGFDGTALSEDSPVVQYMKDYHIGGVILQDHYTDRHTGAVHTRNITSPNQLKQLTDQLQYYAKKYHIYPLLISVDHEGGAITALKASKGFKVDLNYSQLKLGKKNNRHLMYKQAFSTGRLLRQYGVNVDLAPVAALNINPNNPAIGRLGRTFGRGASRVSKDILVTLEGYRESGVACTLKHFPGMGSATKNTDDAQVDISDTWTPQELWPYEAAISSRAVCPLIMVSHVINERLEQKSIPASLSYAVVTKLLRRKLNYHGVIITDDIDADAVRSAFPLKTAVNLAVKAGDNMILYSGIHSGHTARDIGDIYQAILTSAENAPSFSKKVHESYLKIKQLKENYLLK
jgi:beta-N-acetylhexosaminidase